MHEEEMNRARCLLRFANRAQRFQIVFSHVCFFIRVSLSSDVEQFERPSEAERARAASLNAPAEPSRPEHRFRPAQRSRARPISHFERLSKAERARATNFERPCSSEKGPNSQFRAPLRLRGGLGQPLRAALRLRAGSSGHFKRPYGSERARAAITSAQRPRCGKWWCFRSHAAAKPQIACKPPKRRTQI